MRIASIFCVLSLLVAPPSTAQDPNSLPLGRSHQFRRASIHQNKMRLPFEQIRKTRRRSLDPGRELLAAATTRPGWNDSVAERRALWALYESAGGPGWVFSGRRRNNWGDGEPCHCRWTDVTCLDPTACSESPVVRIVFAGAFADHGMNATGTLPGSIFAALEELGHFGMPGNPQLSGSLPEAWAKMTKMEQLALHSNPRLSGTLPP